MKRKLAALLLAVYTLLLLYWMFLGFGRSGRRALPGEYVYNLIPFKTLSEFILHAGSYSPYTLMINLLGNIVVFMPFGLLLPLLFRRCRRWGALLVSVLVPLTAAEVLQMLLGVGTLDMDDLLLNSAGTWLGYRVYRWCVSWSKS